jgi:hypothetical protein
LNRAPLKFLVFDFALTAHNIGPPGQETYRRPELMWVFAELPLKAGNSKQRHSPFPAKLLVQVLNRLCPEGFRY